MAIDELWCCPECYNVRGGQRGIPPNAENRTPDGCPACGAEPDHWNMVGA